MEVDKKYWVKRAVLHDSRAFGGVWSTVKFDLTIVLGVPSSFISFLLPILGSIFFFV
jgi:hypothetical protein